MKPYMENIKCLFDARDEGMIRGNKKRAGATVHIGFLEEVYGLQCQRDYVRLFVSLLEPRLFTRWQVGCWTFD